VTAGDARTFLVESYVPLLDASTAAAISVRIGAAAAELRQEGVSIEWVRSFALVDEQTYFCVLAASDVADVVEANGRARFDYDHVGEVIAIDPCGG
jgi:hypothetical protein